MTSKSAEGARNPASHVRRGVGGVVRYGLLSLLVVVLAAWLLPPRAKLGRSDEQYYGATAWTVLRGGVMYRDCWDNKGPVIHYALAGVTALTKGSPRSYGLTALLLMLVAQASLMLALTRIGEPMAGVGAAALLAACGAAAIAAMLSAELAAAALMALGLIAVAFNSSFAGGLCLGLALLSKPSVAPPIAASMAAWIAAEAVARGRAAAVRLAGWSLFGIFAGCAVPVAVLVGAGAGPDMYRLLVRYNSVHVAAVPWTQALQEFISAGARHLGRTAAASILPLLALPVLLRGRAQQFWRTPMGRCVAVASAWFLASLATYPLLRHFRDPFAYYLLPMLPAGAVLTSLGCAAVRSRRSLYAAVLVGVSLITAFGAADRARVATGAWRRILTGRDLSHWAASDAVQAGLYVRYHSRLEDRVWCGPGATAAHYWTQRAAGCRVICPDYYVNVWPGRKDRWAPPAIAAVFADTWDIIRADLLARRPLYVVLSADPSLAAQETAATARLRQMIETAYSLETVIGKLQLWRLRDTARPSGNQTARR